MKTCAVPGCPWCAGRVELMHPEDAPWDDCTAFQIYERDLLAAGRDFYPAAERLERAIANAEVD